MLGSSFIFSHPAGGHTKEKKKKKQGRVKRLRPVCRHRLAQNARDGEGFRCGTYRGYGGQTNQDKAIMLPAGLRIEARVDWL